jgi:hypothetical protein
MTLLDQRGKSVSLGSLLGKGGEAGVYAVAGKANLVAKIYHVHSAGIADKLKAMVDHPPADATQRKGHISICWPESMLFDSGKHCLGFLMPLLDRSRHRELFHLYNPQDRHVQAPNFTWAYLLKAAENISIVVESIHAKGYVIGDVNESNFFVSDQALVTLVDCDSMQVRTPSAIFRCTVAKPEYLAPELQGKDLSVVDRGPEHDSFALAVLLFLLLMEGIHPYSGIWNGAGDPPAMETRIAAGDSPYAGSPRVKPMPSSPPFDLLPASLRALFVQAFGHGHSHPSARPTAHQWREALQQVQLATCSSNKQHVFPKHLNRCPWCERRALLGGFDPFPALGSRVSQQPLKARPFAPAAAPQPTPAAPPRPAAQSAFQAGNVMWRSPFSTSHALAWGSRVIGLLLLLLSGASALLGLFAFALLSFRPRFSFDWSLWLLAGALGLCLNMGRRRYGRALVNVLVMGGSFYLLLYNPEYAATLSQIPATAGLAAFLASRSLFLLLRRRLEAAIANRRFLQFSIASLMAVALPTVFASIVTAQLAGSPPILASSIWKSLPNAAPAGSPTTQLLTCARIQQDCDCQMKNTFRPGETAFFLLTSRSTPNVSLTATLPGAQPELLVLPKRWHTHARQNCKSTHLTVPANATDAYAHLRMSSTDPTVPAIETGFSVTR